MKPPARSLAPSRRSTSARELDIVGTGLSRSACALGVRAAAPGWNSSCTAEPARLAGAHVAVRSPSMASYSQARANAHSRSTVAPEICEHLGDLLGREPAEELELHHPALSLVQRGQPMQRVLERDQVDVGPARGRFEQAQGDLLGVAAALPGRAVTGVVHQDPPHHARRQAEELGPVPPVDPALVHQPEIGLVHQGGGLEGVAGGLAAQVLGCQAMQLLVDHGEHLIEALLVAPAPVQQPLGDGARGGGRIVGHAGMEEWVTTAGWLGGSGIVRPKRAFLNGGLPQATAVRAAHFPTLHRASFEVLEAELRDNGGLTKTLVSIRNNDLPLGSLALTAQNRHCKLTAQQFSICQPQEIP